MKINKTDNIYILMGIAFAAASAVVTANPNAKVWLLSAAALLAVGLVIAIYINPHLGASVLIVAVFTNISTTFTDNGLPSINKPLVAMVAAAILVRYYNASRLPGGREKTGGIEAFLFVYFMVIALSYVAADNKERTLDAIVDLGKDIVIIYCFLFALRKPETWKQSAWIIIFVTAFLCLLGSFQVLTGNYDQKFFGMAGVAADVGEFSTTQRIAGPITEPNIWAQVVVAVVPLVIYRIIYEKRLRMKLLAAGILGVLLFEILNTYSRGAYLGLGVIVFIILLGQRPRLQTWFGIGAAAVLMLVMLPASYAERFQTLSLLTPSTENGIYQEGSFRGRASKMLTGLTMFARNPILGVGAYNYPNNYELYTQEIGLETETGERDPHSLYVQILAETGILGAIAFMGFSILLLVTLSRTRKSIEHIVKYQSWVPWITAIQLSIVSYMVTSTFLHGGYIRYFWILVALALSAIQLTEELVLETHQHSSTELPSAL